jgi:ABC-type branched-subunit amino acid transport system substrate-binding protein
MIRWRHLPTIDLFDDELDLATLEHFGGSAKMREQVALWRKHVIRIPITDGQIDKANIPSIIEEGQLDVLTALSIGDLQLAFARLTGLLDWMDKQNWFDPTHGRLWLEAARLAAHLGDPDAEVFRERGNTELAKYTESTELDRGLQVLVVPPLPPPPTQLTASFIRRWGKGIAVAAAVAACILVGGGLWFQHWNNTRLEPANALVSQERRAIFALVASGDYQSAITRANRWLQQFPQDALIDLARSNAQVLASGDKYIKIGLSGISSGATGEDYSQAGEAIAQGVNLAVQNHNRNSCTTVKPLASLELQQRPKIVVDIQIDGSTPANSVAVARRFAADPMVLGVVGPITSASSLEAGRVYAQSQLPHLLPTATLDDLGNPDYPYTFRMAPSNTQLAHAMVRLISERLPGQGVLVVYDTSKNRPNNQGLAEAFSASAKRANLRNVEIIGLNLSLPSDQLTQQPRLQTVAEGDAVFVAAGYNEVANLANALPKRAVLFAGDGAYSQKLLTLAPETAKGLTVLSFFHVGMGTDPAFKQNLQVNAFTKNFKGCYGKALPNARAAQAFDSAQTLFQTFTSINISRSDVYASLDAFDGAGITSPVAFRSGLIVNRPLVELSANPEGRLFEYKRTLY